MKDFYFTNLINMDINWKIFLFITEQRNNMNMISQDKLN